MSYSKTNSNIVDSIISINEHSSICIATSKKIYFDPYNIKEESHDADIIFFTHSHYDHFSKKDYEKVSNKQTILVMPKSMYEYGKEIQSKFEKDIMFLIPEEIMENGEMKIKGIRAYNVEREYHKKSNDWLGYVVEIDNVIYYVCGDTDSIKEAKNVKCDVIFVPIGGTYTMNYSEAANLVNKIKPKIAIPTHYGSIVGDKEDAIKFKNLVQKDIKVILKI